MPIKLNSTGGGSVSIDVPSTASTYTLTAPAETGTVITSGTTTRIIPKASMPAGSVIQVVQGVKTDTWSALPAAGTYSPVTGLSVSITPQFSNSKILVTVNMFVGYQAYMFKGLIKRNGNIILQGDAAGVRPRSTIAGGSYAGSATYEQYQLLPTSMTYLDSPATTSACSYTVELACYSTNAVTLNRSYVWQASANDYDGTPASTIIAMEIAQ
jgi:hypothetical protein